jgi:25S rRNA (adenine2142-N1)-methyltransferase
MTKKRARRPKPLTATKSSESRSSSSLAEATPTTHQPMKSRKRARKVTTLFHKYTRQRDLALESGDTKTAQDCETKLEQMGGRIEYQKASQLSTMHHSTSKKWVLGHLASNGWLYGIKDKISTNISITRTAKERRKAPRRTTRILEVGAINTDLLDAAQADEDRSSAELKNKHNIHVRSIDLHAMDPRIEEADFLELPYTHSDIHERYDVVVCSMVLNCVTKSLDRGKMLCRLYHHLRPGGLCFLTIPKFCLTKSAFLNPELFQQMLTDGVGFDLEDAKDSPRISFFLLKRPLEQESSTPSTTLDPKWTKEVVRNKGKKFPNQFSVVLHRDHVFEENIDHDP